MRGQWQRTDGRPRHKGKIMTANRVVLCVATLAAIILPGRAANMDKMNMGAISRIDCPLAEIRREVTTPLPEGWWNTPYIGPVQRTYIQNVGGLPTLMCDYGNAGIIMHRVPQGAVCRPAGNGFECRP